MEGKQTLSRYSLKSTPQRESFYDGSWGSSLLFKARAGALELNDRTYRFNPRNSKECEYGCMVNGRIVDETVQHVMTECQGYSEAMIWAIAEYRRVLGEEGFREITLRGDDDQGTNFFLGFGKDIPIEIMEITKRYLVWIWAVRQTKVNLGSITENPSM